MKGHNLLFDDLYRSARDIRLSRERAGRPASVARPAQRWHTGSASTPHAVSS